MQKLTVILNGTDEKNPFPQSGQAEYDQHCLHLAKLAADPIPNTDYIRTHLAGWSQEFIDLCCIMFRKGEIVKFDFSFIGTKPYPKQAPPKQNESA